MIQDALFGAVVSKALRAAGRRLAMMLLTALPVLVSASASEPLDYIARWAFDEDLQDSGGMNLHAAPVGGAAVFGAGKIGSALVLDGGSAYVAVPGAAALRLTGDLSWSSWLWLDEYRANASVFAYGAYGESKATNTLYSLTQIAGDAASGVVSLWSIHERGPGYNRIVAFPDVMFPLQQWRHVVLLRDATKQTMSLYLDGALAGSGGYSGNAEGGTAAEVVLAFGANVGLQPAAALRGRLDDARLYGRRLSVEEIIAIRDSAGGGTPVDTPPMITAAPTAMLNSAQTQISLAVLADDDAGEAALRYTWSAMEAPMGAAPGFVTNGDNAAKNCLVTLDRAGLYRFSVTVSDAADQQVVATTGPITVAALVKTVAVTVPAAPVPLASQVRLSATVSDQFAQPLPATPVWSLAAGGAGGAIDTTGLYTAPSVLGSTTSELAIATVAGQSGTGSFTIAVGKPTIRVYLLAGQSNAQGQALSADLSAADKAIDADLLIYDRRVNRVAALRVGRSGANNHYGDQEGSKRTFGPELGLGRRLRQLVGGPIGLIKFARNGSAMSLPNPSFGTWDPEAVDSHAQTLTDEYLTPGLAAYATHYNIIIGGMLWVQGEADADARPEYEGRLMQYQERSEAFLQAVQAAVTQKAQQMPGVQLEQPQLPVVVVRNYATGYLWSPDILPLERWQAIRRDQERLGDRWARRVWLDCDAYPANPNAADRIHHGAAAQLALGAEAAELLRNLANNAHPTITQGTDIELMVQAGEEMQFPLSAIDPDVAGWYWTVMSISGPGSATIEGTGAAVTVQVTAGPVAGEQTLLEVRLADGRGGRTAAQIIVVATENN